MEDAVALYGPEGRRMNLVRDHPKAQWVSKAILE
ncbi:hypothetical protein PSP6_80246 [Paraburkholderia tropica]|nr:hypothetical protein PSP6_80246 [Paraburkholderia tropica]